jgi:hypothetical protein
MFNVSDVLIYTASATVTGPPLINNLNNNNNNNNNKDSKDNFESLKYYTINGVAIPGFLFHTGKTSKTLIENFENSLGDSPNQEAIIKTVDFIESEINKARSIMKHGFIYSVDLTNEEAFPVIANYIEDILIDKGLSKQRTKNSVFDDDETLTPLEILENCNAKIKADAFKQVYHLICLNY